MRRWVSDAERTVNTVAVFGWDLLQVRVHLWCQVVTRLAEEVGTEAREYSDRATILALPVDLNLAMLGTFCLTSTDGFQGAVGAAKVFLFARVSVSLLGSFLFAINQATEVRLLALEALVERATMHGIVQVFLEVEISGVFDSAISEDTLQFAVLKSLSLDFILELNVGAEDFGDDFDMESINWC